MSWFDNRILAKLFLVTKEWSAAWKEIGDKKFRIIKNPDGYWLADTLVYENKENTYLFVEAYNKVREKGEIGVLEFKEGDFKNFRIVLKEKYHLSYPMVFDLYGKTYMIPESSENNTVDLYEAIDFPDSWKKIKTLISKSYVDTTIEKHNENEIKLYTYDDSSKMMLTYLWNIKTNSMELIDSIVDSKNELRGGGTPFSYNNMIVRTVQNNKSLYGRSLRMVDCISNSVVKK